MKSILSFISTILSFVSFLYILFCVLLISLMILMSISNISTVLESGFATAGDSLTILAIMCFLTAITFFFPPARNTYHYFPWLFPLVKILLVNLTIMSIAIGILNYGYQVKNDARHIMFIILMVLQLIISRALVSVYFSKKKLI